MAKIYEWAYKSDVGRITADNMKEAKRQVANKFGNAIKIPKGTSIKKIGLSKGKSPAKLKSVEIDPPRKIAVDNLPHGTVLTGPKGKTYTIGQRGKKPDWLDSAQVGNQKTDTPDANKRCDVVDILKPIVEYESQSYVVLKRKSQVTGPAMINYEIGGKMSNCYISEEATIFLPKDAKVWKTSGSWSIL